MTSEAIVHGVQYVRKATLQGACVGCAGLNNRNLCWALPDQCVGENLNTVWVEAESSALSDPPDSHPT